MQKKILHIIRANAVAGAENHIFMMLPALGKLGYNVSLLTLTDGKAGNYDEAYGKKLNELKLKGVDVFEETIKNKFDFTAVSKISKLIKEIKPDLVHTHLPYADLFGAWAAKKAGIKLVINSHHYDYSVSKKEIKRFKLYYSIANYWHDSVIPISGRIAQLCKEIEGWREGDINTVLYGCEEQCVNKEKAREKILCELGLAPKTLVIGTVARLIPLKGHIYAIDALSKLVKNNESITWLFIGSGPEKENLENIAAEKNVRQKIKFLGHRTDIPELTAALDIMVHPTMAEGFGLIFLEAMIQSVPIISTRTGSIPEIICENKTGIIVEPRNGEKIAEAIQYLIDNPKIRTEFGLNGRKRYEEFFTIEVMARNISKVYEGLLDI